MTDRRARLTLHPDSEPTETLELLDATQLTVSVAASATWVQQVLAIALVDLLGRLHPHVHLDVPDQMRGHPDLPPGPDLFIDRLRASCQRGQVHSEVVPTGAPVTVSVGAATPDADLHVDASNWVAYLGTEPPRLEADVESSPMPFAALTAAARAAAHVANIVFRTTPAPPASSYVDILRYRTSTNPLEHDPVILATPTLDHVLAGVGSVGGAAVYALAAVPELHGTLLAVDPQQLKANNVDRAILVSNRAAAAEGDKVQLAVDKLRHHKLEVDPFVGTLEEWNAAGAARPLPPILCAVHSRNARDAIQDELPLHVINAAVSPTLTTVSRHITGHGPCMCCMHISDVLNRKRTHLRILADQTGLNRRRIIQLIELGAHLTDPDLRSIERHRGLPTGELQAWARRSLTDLHEAELLYGRRQVTVGSEQADVAAPSTTALAGFLLACEAVKQAAGIDQLALGPDGLATAWLETVGQNPINGYLDMTQRWDGSECLCRSPRRMRIIEERYGLRVNEA